MFIPFGFKKLSAISKLIKVSISRPASIALSISETDIVPTAERTLDEDELVIQEVSDAWHDTSVLNVRKNINLSICAGQIRHVHLSDPEHTLEYHRIISSFATGHRQPSKPSQECERWTPSLTSIEESALATVIAPVFTLTCNAYTAIKKLGAGSNGTVYLAESKVSGGLHAIKKVTKALLAPEDIPALLREQSILRQVQDDEHFISLDASFHDSEAFFLVTSFCPGGTLRAQLNQCGRFSPSRALYCMAELLLACKALQSRGIVHRDIKPENILIDGKGHLVLGDFGLACSLDVAATGALCGTPAHMAPEVFQELPYGFSVDLWAAAIVFFELITGRTPFQSAGSIADIALSVQTEPVAFRSSDDVDFLVQLFLLHTLQKDRKHRLDLDGMMKHLCFQSTNWGMLAHREFASPWKPSFKALQQDIHNSRIQSVDLALSSGIASPVDDHIGFKFEAATTSFGIIPSSSSQDLSTFASSASSSTVSSDSGYSTVSTPATTPATTPVGSPVMETCSVFDASSDIIATHSRSSLTLPKTVLTSNYGHTSSTTPKADGSLPETVSFASLFSCTSAFSIAPLEHDDQPISSPEFFSRPNPIGRLMRKLIGASASTLVSTNNVPSTRPGLTAEMPSLPSSSLLLPSV
ncbi:kinase-like domain-containing protein [Amylostereum chailletii]|nr:kinase-like domain-containing protein [Amylostereum chailletii]